MFHLNQAALLFIQLYMCQVFAVSGIHPVDHIQVSRGDSVTFTCNISMERTSQINWTKGRFLFSYLVQNNQTFSNFTSHRLRIDLNLSSHTKLKISNAQSDDAGLFTCKVIGRSGPKIAEWNLTVSGKPEEISSSWYFLHILTPVIGFLLCGIPPAVCLCRKLKARTPNQNQVQDQVHPESGGEEELSRPQGGADRRTNNKQTNQYMERLNSLYGAY